MTNHWDRQHNLVTSCFLRSWIYRAGPSYLSGEPPSTCGSCRRRKIKCDGVRPACGPCTRHNNNSRRRSAGQEWCEYAYEESVEPRSRESFDSDLASPTSVNFDSSPQPAHRQTRPVVPASTSIQNNSSQDLLPLNLACIQVFLRRFSSSPYWFIETNHFRQLHHPPTPPRANSLLASIYLWAATIEPNSEFCTGNELAVAEHYLEADLSLASAADRDSNSTLDIIQSFVMMSVYFLHYGNYEEGRRLCIRAIEFAHAHQILQNAGPEIRRCRQTVSFLSNAWDVLGGLPGLLDLPELQPPSDSTIGMTDITGGHALNFLIDACQLLKQSTDAATRQPISTQHLHRLVLEVTAFKTRLIYLRRMDESLRSSFSSSLLLAGCLANIALLGLYWRISTVAPANSDERLLVAMTQAIADVERSDEHRLDPLIGPLISAVSNFYIAHLLSTASHTHSQAILLRLLSLVSRLAPVFPSINPCLDVCLQAYMVTEL
ncbi:Zn(2)-C6 fungal-type domain-containing protein [Mycena indigotica]|uniref:Zn(2)-C6 fungal-type domain-containing protein n=1 Tax=Mycena indigotica TaxID=2126181 RepID=A0A8H6T1J3_9AGAR|nr:Zn(2)-C6 fungal-type domain-containing protein [Mycena indigotica]KAF7309336.1 Zn(2)-C6 fungal-type domain-containing protein [Mycena indigotica]